MTCNHEFAEVDDWEGDPSLPGGMNRIAFWKCIHCGEERSEKPSFSEIYEPDYEALPWN